jgi:zinc-ribbon domain
VRGSKCANCGARLARGARFCPQCGQPTASGDTLVMEVPPDETGPVPVNVSHVEPRFYGVTPPLLALVLAGGAATVAILLFIGGHWPYGLILLGIAVLLVLAFLETARRRPERSASEATPRRLDTFRSRGRVAAESIATRGRARRQVYALRQELARMAVDRDRLLFDLGNAVYRGDEQATEEARSRVEELDRLAAEREAEMQQVLESAQDVLARGRLEVQPTEVAEAPQEPDPAPGEGSPPEPARIPERGPQGKKGRT